MLDITTTIPPSDPPVPPESRAIVGRPIRATDERKKKCEMVVVASKNEISEIYNKEK